VLRCPPRPCCARPLLVSRLVLLPGVLAATRPGPCPSPLPRGLRLRCAPPASPFRCAGLVPASSVPLSAARLVSRTAPPWAVWFFRGVLVHRWWRLRRSVRCPARLAWWFRLRVPACGCAAGFLLRLWRISSAPVLPPWCSDRFSPGAAPLAFRFVFQPGPRCVSRAIRPGPVAPPRVLVPA
jgi:hypothetical protein